MAEGQARLNQQVVDMEHWSATNRASPTVRPPSARERERRLDDIRKAVEVDVLPRVAGGHESVVGRPVGRVPMAAVLGLVKVLLAHDDEAAVAAHVASVQAQGISVDDIYLHLFQPAARHIGELWCDDLCSFVDVTLAVGTLQKMLRTLAPAFHQNSRAGDGTRQALVVPLPGDQHTFGLSMVAEFLRRAGWGVWSTPVGTCDALCDTVARLWFTVVGFSASNEDRLDELTTVIRQVRRQSCNAAVRVMVGGPLFVLRPDYVARVGADAMGIDAVHTLTLAERFAAAVT